MNNNNWLPNGRPPRTIILTRVSTASQEDNTSHDVQLDACERAANFNGWEVVERLPETVSGALYTSREETQLALSMLERDEADLLLLYDMTRYGRDVEYQHKILKRIIRAGKRLQFSGFMLQYDDYTGELTPESEQYFNMVGGNSSSERAYIKRRMRNGKIRKVEEGVQPSRSRHPYGYRVAQKVDVIRGTYPEGSEGKYFIAEEIENVRLIYAHYNETSSLRGTCLYLHSLGIPSPTGNPTWHPSVIKGILNNPIYVGRPAWGKYRHLIDESRKQEGLKSHYKIKTTPDTWKYLSAPAIISEELFAEIQAKLAAGHERAGRRDRKYLLTRLLRCPKCDLKMSGYLRKSQGVRYYQCQARSLIRDENKTGGCITVTAVPLEEVVISAICQILEDPTLIHKIEELETVPKKPLRIDPKTALEKELAKLSARERAVIESRIEAKMNKIPTGTFDDILRETNLKIQAVKKQISKLRANREKPSIMLIPKDESKATVASLLNPQIPDIEKNTILSQFIKTIVPESMNAAVLTLDDASETRIRASRTEGGIQLKLL